MKDLDLEAVKYYFTLGYIPSPMSIWEDGQKTRDPSFGFEKFEPISMKEQEWVHFIHRTLRFLISEHLTSFKSPVCCYLSGGIDSGLISSIIVKDKLINGELKTFSVGFDDKSSEVKYSRKIAEYLGTNHHELIVDSNSYQRLPEIVSCFEEPISDNSMVPTFLLTEWSKKYTNTIFSGDGGDELFMGYPGLKDPSFYKLYSWLPLRKTFLKLLLKMPVSLETKKSAYFALETDYGGSEIERFIQRSLLVKIEHSAPITYMKYLYDGIFMDSANELERLVYVMMNTLSVMYLTKDQEINKHFSMDVRCPIMDKMMVRISQHLPYYYKYRNDTTKYILRKIGLEMNLLPREILKRKKQGFGAPISNWMNKGYFDYCKYILDVDSDEWPKFVPKDDVNKWLQEPYFNSQKIFSLVVFLLWLRQQGEYEIAP